MSVFDLEKKVKETLTQTINERAKMYYGTLLDKPFNQNIDSRVASLTKLLHDIVVSASPLDILYGAAKALGIDASYNVAIVKVNEKKVNAGELDAIGRISGKKAKGTTKVSKVSKSTGTTEASKAPGVVAAAKIPGEIGHTDQIIRDIRISYFRWQPPKWVQDKSVKKAVLIERYTEGYSKPEYFISMDNQEFNMSDLDIIEMDDSLEIGLIEELALRATELTKFRVRDEDSMDTVRRYSELSLSALDNDMEELMEELDKEDIPVKPVPAAKIAAKPISAKLAAKPILAQVKPLGVVAPVQKIVVPAKAKPAEPAVAAPVKTIKIGLASIRKYIPRTDILGTKAPLLGTAYAGEVPDDELIDVVMASIWLIKKYSPETKLLPNVASLHAAMAPLVSAGLSVDHTKMARGVIKYESANPMVQVWIKSIFDALKYNP